MYVITLHQPWATLFALAGEERYTRSWPAPERLLGPVIASHAGKRLVRRPGDRIGQELRNRVGQGRRRTIPGCAVMATATPAVMTRVECADPMTDRAVYDAGTEKGYAVEAARTGIDARGDFSSGRWLWSLVEDISLSEPIPAVGHQLL